MNWGVAFFSLPMSIRTLLTALLTLAAIARGSAQQPVSAVLASSVADSLKAGSGTSYLDNNINGYGKAEILGPDGKTHYAYVLINAGGFGRYLPFYRREDEIRKFGNVPFSIDVDKVQSLKLNGLYQEHIVLKGKRKHILATRLVKGPVELFNFTQVLENMAMPNAGAGMMAGGFGGRTDSRWYLRRQGGELVEVDRIEFIAQMTHYFHDDTEIVVALKQRKLRYQDMVAVVQGYNEYLTHPAAGQPTGDK